MSKDLTIGELRRRLPAVEMSKILDFPYPKPYPDNLVKIKAILIGCDPSNSHCQNLPYVFAIKSSHKVFSSFVKSIKNQLGAVGLSLETVYCQNLCRNYFKDETSKNPIWEDVAKLWVPFLKKELDEKFAKTVPVLLTAESLYKVLLNETVPRRKAREFYDPKYQATIPIPAAENQLSRPLIPFYRHRVYNFYNNKWNPYQKLLRQLFTS